MLKFKFSYVVFFAYKFLKNAAQLCHLEFQEHNYNCPSFLTESGWQIFAGTSLSFKPNNGACN